ncbi:MAG: ATP-binding protein [Opitutales bacterium]|nr:ATP-binding protein [Opitutales bacterium]
MSTEEPLSKKSLANSCKLRSLTLKNFRIFKDITIEFQDLCAIVGKNNCGKSTILKALDIFFSDDDELTENDRHVEPEREREREREQSDSIEITCSFEIAGDADIILPSGDITTLAAEHFLDEKSRLTITKRFTWGKQNQVYTTKYICPKEHLTYHDRPLSCLSFDKLKSTYNFLAPNDKKYYSKPKLRQKLWEIYQPNQSRLKREAGKIYIDTSEDDCNTFCQYILKALPRYYLFKADTISYSNNKNTSDFTKKINDKIIEKLQPQLNELQSNVEKELGISTEAINEQIKVDFPENLKNSFQLTEHTQLNNKHALSLFDYSFKDQTGLPIEQQGSGLNRLLLFALFKAEAKEQNNEGRNVIYALEEPEIGQHPDWQLHLLKTILTLSKTGHHQVLFTTHTPEIVNIPEISSQTVLVQNGKAEKIEGNKRKLIEEMGLLPYFSKNFLLVEGLCDQRFFENINNISDFKEIFDTSKKIYIINAQGKDTMKNPHNVLSELCGLFTFMIMDKDDGNEPDQPGLTHTKTRELENYFSVEFYREFSKNTQDNRFKNRFNNLTDNTTPDWDNADIMKDVLKVTNKEEEKDCKSAVQSYFQTLVGGKETTLANLEKNLRYKIFSDGAVEDIKRILMEAKNYLFPEQETTSSATEEPIKTEDPIK